MWNSDFFDFLHKATRESGKGKHGRPALRSDKQSLGTGNQNKPNLPQNKYCFLGKTLGMEKGQAPSGKPNLGLGNGQPPKQNEN